MRVFIIASGGGGGENALDERYLAPMIPLIDRPFLQHIVEYLMGKGATHFEFVLSHLAEKVDSWLGDGTRWGNEWAERMQVRLVSDPDRPYDVLRHIELPPDEKVLLIHGDTLPDLDGGVESPWERFFCREGWWSGCVLLDASRLGALPEGIDRSGLEAWVRQRLAPAEVPETLAVATYEGLMEAHWSVLSGEFPGLMITGREVEDGVWLSRNVSLHPSVKIEGPVYIGENCRIGAGVSLGPGVVICPECVLDKMCKVENALLLPRSYVGQSLDLIDVVVDGSFVVNFRLGSAIAVPEDFILGGIGERRVGDVLAFWAGRGAAVFMLALTWPLLFGAMLWLRLSRRGPVSRLYEFVSLPSSRDEAEWRTFRVRRLGDGSSRRHFFSSFLPGLINVVRGEMRFVGLKPRSKEEIRSLPTDWQGVYLQGNAGLVSEADLLAQELSNEEERYAADAFQVATGSGYNNLRLFLRYLKS